jgi:hypothetical protein
MKYLIDNQLPPALARHLEQQGLECHWYESQRLGLGADLFAVVDAAFAKIASNPMLCPRLETWTAGGDIRRLLTRLQLHCLGNER